MTDEYKRSGPLADQSPAYEPERRSIERAMHAYATYLRSQERYQQSVADFRRARSTHEAIQATLGHLAEGRASAAAGRLDIRTAVRTYVQRLRAEERPPEVALRMAKWTCRSIAFAIPADDALRNPDALLEDTVRWAIEAYYDAA
jgi:hypothetical protein